MIQTTSKWLCFPVIIALVFFAVFFTDRTAAGSAEPETVYVVSVSGTVDPGMAAFIKRVHEKTSKTPDALVILEMDTFGGRVDSALEIVNTLLKFPREKTVAYVTRKAISAGALIALSCGRLAMKPGTTIGDCAPISISDGSPKMLGEKFQSPIRAQFRALAKRNGYPEALAEAMVTPEKKVYQLVMKDGKRMFMDSRAYDDMSKAEKAQVIKRRTIVPAGELLTMDDTEAHELGFSMMSVSSVNELLNRLGIRNYKRVSINESWSESMVRYIDSILPILMMIGLGAIYIEMKSPGFGVPGIIGITCLAIVFLNQYMVGLATYTEFLILIAGIILVGGEIFVLPGFGIAGFLGILMIIAGLVLSMQNFVIPNPAIPWETKLMIGNVVRVLGAYLGAILFGLLFIRYILPRLSVRRQGPVLASNLKDARADSKEVQRLRVGDSGFALTFLRPSGKAEINDDIFDVITYNEYLERGTPIVVSEIRGNRVIVTRKERL